MFAQIPYFGDEGVPRVWCEHSRYWECFNVHNWMTRVLSPGFTPSAINLEAASLVSVERHVKYVPESRDCIKYAAWAAVRAVRNTPRWASRKQRIRSRGVIEHIDCALDGITSTRLRLVQDPVCKYIFYFE